MAKKSIPRRVLEGLLDKFFGYLQLDVVASDAAQTRRVVKNLTGLGVTLFVVMGIGGCGGMLYRNWVSSEIETSYDERALAEAHAYRHQGRIIESYRLDREKLQSQLSGLLPEEVARQIATNMPPDERLDAIFDLLRKQAKELVAIRDYSDVAQMDAAGHKFRGAISDHSDLTRMLDGTLSVQEDGKTMRPRLDESAERIYREVISRFPEFPFAYYFLAGCLRSKNDPAWLSELAKAKEILEITTTISGHHEHHDDVLRRINVSLSKARDEMGGTP